MGLLGTAGASIDTPHVTHATDAAIDQRIATLAAPVMVELAPMSLPCVVFQRCVCAAFTVGVNKGHTLSITMLVEEEAIVTEVAVEVALAVWKPETGAV